MNATLLCGLKRPGSFVVAWPTITPKCAKKDFNMKLIGKTILIALILLGVTTAFSEYRLKEMRDEMKILLFVIHCQQKWQNQQIDIALGLKFVTPPISKEDQDFVNSLPDQCINGHTMIGGQLVDSGSTIGSIRLASRQNSIMMIDLIKKTENLRRHPQQ